MFDNFSRRQFLALTGASGAALVIAACAPPPAAPAVKEEVPKPEEPAPAAPAPVELSYYYGTRVVFADLGLVQEAMSEYMKDRINATIELNPIEWAAFSDKMSIKNAAGEKYDMCFTSSWANPYLPNVQNGVLADLTDALPQYAPKYYGSLNPAVWLAPKVQGRIYGAVNQQIFPAALGPTCRKDLAEKYGLDLPSTTAPTDLEPWWDQILANEPDIVPVREGSIFYVIGPKWTDSPGYGLVEYDDADIKVVHDWDSERQQMLWKQVRGWYLKRYLPQEPVPRAEQEAMVIAGKRACNFHRAKPGGEVEQKAINGWDWISKIHENPTVLTTGNIISTMYGVNKQTSSLEACARYLELVNTDKVFYNLLCKGIEGKHWVWKNKEKEVIAFPEGLDVSNHPYNPNSDWEFGDQFLAYYMNEDQVGAWEATRRVNDASVPSVLLGFVLDREPIKNELAAISAAVAEYADMGLGMMDLDTVLPKYIEVVKAAGAVTVIEEVQRQIDAWKAGA
ncbi:MAG: ABC transporter substrate-binding protein [Chloroflexi bacterium]|nr:ABC transporter substrate-binding protein [Chloroflexota bacterium]